MANPLIQQKVKIGDKSYMIASDDDYLKYIGSEFEPYMCFLFQSLIEKNYKIYDIGANIGCTTLLFGDLAREVDSFEPSPSTFEILRQNLAISSQTNTRIHNFALGAKNENLTLTFSPSNRSGGLLATKSKREKIIRSKTLWSKKEMIFFTPQKSIL